MPCFILATTLFSRVNFNIRPAEISNRGKRVHNLFFLGPGDVDRKRLRSALNVARREPENDFSKPLWHQISDRDSRKGFPTTNIRCSLTIKHESMEKLRKRDGHQQPAAEPPRAPIQQAFRVQDIKQEFQTSGACVNRRGQSELVLRTDAQRETSQTCADRWRKARGQRPRDTRVALSEWLCLIGAEVRSQSDEKAVEEAMDEKEEREGDGEAEFGRPEEGRSGLFPVVQSQR